jgi:hypothetical protein
MGITIIPFHFHAIYMPFQDIPCYFHVIFMPFHTIPCSCHFHAYPCHPIVMSFSCLSRPCMVWYGILFLFIVCLSLPWYGIPFHSILFMCHSMPFLCHFQVIPFPCLSMSLPFHFHDISMPCEAMHGMVWYVVPFHCIPYLGMLKCNMSHENLVITHVLDRYKSLHD